MKQEAEATKNSPYPFTVEEFAGGGTRLEGAAYFWFFTKLMLGTAVLFVPYALFYREKTWLQE